MRGLRTKRARTVKEGTLIATVDIGATTNTGRSRELRVGSKKMGQATRIESPK